MNVPSAFLKSSLLFLVLSVVLVVSPQNAAAAKPDPLLAVVIEQIGQQTNRDIVVIDKSKTILADSVVQNVGTKYPHDTGDEVSKTLADGKTRTFTEKSVDYPKGIKETVSAVKDSKGEIIAALIVSSVPAK